MSMAPSATACTTLGNGGYGFSLLLILYAVTPSRTTAGLPGLYAGTAASASRRRTAWLMPALYDPGSGQWTGARVPGWVHEVIRHQGPGQRRGLVGRRPAGAGPVSYT